MPDPYSNERWIKFRNEVIELDGEICLRCRRGFKDGMTLQVHHKHYRSGAAPWEYLYTDCETLCKGCHAREHGKVRPSVGWEFLGTDDLGGLSGICEYCGTEIRYVFFIQHLHWEPLAVGTYCCDNLTETALASNHMESLRRFASRRTRFISSRRWKESGGGMVIHQKGIEVLIRMQTAGFQIQMNDTPGKIVFPNMVDAKAKAFETIESGAAEKCLRLRAARQIARREGLDRSRKVAGSRAWVPEALASSYGGRERAGARRS
jgi:hypothetical protein